MRVLLVWLLWELSSFLVFSLALIATAIYQDVVLLYVTLGWCLVTLLLLRLMETRP